MYKMLVGTRCATACLGLMTLPVQAGFMAVEYVRDASAPPVFMESRQVGRSLFSTDTSQFQIFEQRGWVGTLDVASYQLRVPGNLIDPPGLSMFSVGGALQRKMALGAYPMVSSVDVSYRRALRAMDSYSQAHAFAIGPRISFTPGTTTHLYYRYAHERPADTPLDPAMSWRDTDTIGAGVAQVWRFVNRGGELRLGYEIGENRILDKDIRMAGHKLNLSGRIPLMSGLDARFEADYSWNLYPEYQGLLELESYRREFKVGLVGTLGENLRAGINYSYEDEDVDADSLSYRRRAWGLNFSYTY